MDSSKKHILIADSDEQSLIELERLFEDAGFETTTAWSTSDTIEHVGRRQFDVLLVADHPPELNCEQILRVKRQSGTQAPVIVLQTRPRHPFSEPYLAMLGASGFAPKSSHRDIKLAVLGALGTESPAAKSAVAGTANLG